MIDLESVATDLAKRLHGSEARYFGQEYEIEGLTGLPGTFCLSVVVTRTGEPSINELLRSAEYAGR